MESIMCMQLKGNMLGCSYYSNENLKLYVMEDAIELNDFSYTSMIIAQSMPKLILVSDSNNDAFVSFLEGYDEAIEIKKIPSKEFTFEKGRYMLLNWYMDHVNLQNESTSVAGTDIVNSNMILVDPEEGNKTQAYLKLEGLINLNESQLTKKIGCVGVLLKFVRKLEQQKIDESMDLEQSMQPILLEVFSNNMSMQIDTDTSKSLSIFEYELHPNMHQKREKESLSLFGLLNKTKSILGKQRLKEWISRPITNKQMIEERHSTVEFFLRPDIREELQELRDYLSQIRNIHRLLPKIREHKALSNDWQYILKIDFESSKREGRIVIKENVNAELDFLKKRYESLDDYLLEVAQEIGATLPVGFGAALNVVYFPQLGYLITLPKYCRTSENGNQSAHSSITATSENTYDSLFGFNLQFTTADNLYYKNARTRELDETIGDIYTIIIDKEIEIIQGLSERVLEYKKQFTDIADILSNIDCLVSLSVAALKFGYTRPTMTDTNVLKIIKGSKHVPHRHPLQELCVETFIPNDTHLEGGKGFKYEQDTTSTVNSVQVVTGANFSGKSVYLKQVALITYMAHIGSFVPAQSATIGITDRLFTRTQTLETISKPQSAFAYDLQQVQKALNHSTCHSLVIIDEFGKGTENADGAALFCSILGYFLSTGSNCPKVLASTHFHVRDKDLISQNILSSRDCITLSQTDIICQEISQVDDKSKRDEAVFLYRIVPGIGYISSYGVWCAGIAGLPTSVVERALVLSEKYSKGEEIDRVTNDYEQEHFKQLEAIFKQFISVDVNEMNPNEIIGSIKHLFGKE
ncbi:hypothetical protein G6F16_009379 [Rhizopus arrhizus]|nr:hypothetical protein G6F16_009379 [Rhizopus arrhizus]